jgi:glucoamylase
MQERTYEAVLHSPERSDLSILARYLLPLMLRNVSSDGYVFTDPADPTKFSAPGSVIASPSYDRNLASVNQNYVYNWTRDAAIAAIEIALADLPVAGGAGSGPLGDYVRFASICQENAPNLGRACYTIDGRPRDWTDQGDGPALQTLAVLTAYGQLDGPAQATARSVVQRNVDYLLAEYENPSYNLWEETRGQSFFARSVQLRCLIEIKGNSLALPVPPTVDEAIDRLRQAMQDHWNGEYYVSLLDVEQPRDDYDPNIDIVMASVYGAVECTDPRLLATAARLRRQWSDPASASSYPINLADAQRGLGPLLGRYPGDLYDGNTLDAINVRGHPWAVCTANFAELYYTVAAGVQRSQRTPIDALSTEFFGQVGVDRTTSPDDAAHRLRDAGDAMLQAVVYHSDHLELSEQFDAATGYEKSVRNLTWSYAAVLSALRASPRAQPAPQPDPQPDPPRRA